ncbi:immediate early response 2b [Entelurus aequoreus]|uniref:immediate early response 2b n=1 Tax=Entelurus aequoreus TaxID=161455 RepID=UPI002B1E0781|nr:immediate early response 2b [Entelurus aequoreus]
MMEATTMEVNAEARRVLAVSISKLYASRAQRGGLRLHRSLLLSLVMRSARDIYHLSSPPPMECGTDEADEAAEVAEAEPPQPEPTPAEPSAAAGGGARQEADAVDTEEEEEEDMEEGELVEDKENRSPTSRSRKRRGKTSAAPDFLPSKRARLEPGEERHSSAPPPPVSCRLGPAESLMTLSLNRVIPAC